MSTQNLLHHTQHPPQPPTPILACCKAFSIMLPIAQIAVGAVYLGECPRQPYIPIYLMVMGCFGLLQGVLYSLPCTLEAEDSTGSRLSRFCTTLYILISLFVLCWFITGNVWIYSIYEPNYNKTSTLNSTSLDEYCNKTLYLFAFWTITLMYILSALILLAGCCAFCRKAAEEI